MSMGPQRRININELVFDGVLVISSLLLPFVFPHGVPFSRISPVLIILCYAATAFIVPVYLGFLNRGMHRYGIGVRRAATATTLLVDVFLFGCYGAFCFLFPNDAMGEELWIAVIAISCGGLIWGILIGAMSALPVRKRMIYPQTKKNRRRAHTDSIGIVAAAVVIPMLFMVPGMIIVYLRLETTAKTIEPHYCSLLFLVFGFLLVLAIAIMICIGAALGIRAMLNFLARFSAVRSIASLIIAPLLIALALFFWYQLSPFVIEGLFRVPKGMATMIALIVSGILPVRILMLLVPPIRPVNVIIGSAAVVLSAVLPLYSLCTYARI